jgi:hypothetical protein
MENNRPGRDLNQYVELDIKTTTMANNDRHSKNYSAPVNDIPNIFKIAWSSREKLSNFDTQKAS